MSLIRLPIIRHGQYTWDKSLLPETEFARRIGRVRAAMRELRLDSFVVYSDMVHSGRAAWLINCHVFDPRMPNAVLLTPDAFDAVLKVTGRDLIFFQKFTSARLFNVDFLSGDLAGKLRDLASEHGVVGKRIGLVGATYMPADTLEKLRHDFGADNIVDCEDAFTRLLRDKSDVEHDIMRKAAALTDKVLADVAAHVRPGVNERAVGARADYAARRGGAQDVEFLVYSEKAATAGAWPRSHFPFRPVSAATLAEGDELGVYLAVQLQSYWVELTQTIFVGAPRPGRADAHREAAARFAELLGNLRPASNRAFDDMSDDTAPVWVHGSGNDREEAPISRRAGERIANGDLLCAHVAVRTPEGPVFLGRQVSIAADGGHMLSGARDLSRPLAGG